jgi:hypothetical protein
MIKRRQLRRISTPFGAVGIVSLLALLAFVIKFAVAQIGR